MSQYNQIENPYQEIFDQYADVSSFLWVLRSLAVHRPHYSIQDIIKLEKRIQAQLDGLMSSIDEGWKACDKGLEIGEAGEVFTASVFAIRSHEMSHIRTAVEIGLSNEDAEKGLISAMGWLPENLAHPWIDKFLNGKDLRHKYLGVASCGVRRHDPGDVLSLLASRDDCQADPKLYSRVIRLIGELRRQDLMPLVLQSLTSDSQDIRFWAAWTSILLGDKRGLKLIKPFVFLDSIYRKKAIDIAFRALSVDVARNWISEMAAEKVAEKFIIRATSVLGDPHAVNWLINKMKKPPLSRLAGEAFSMITGADFEKLGMVVQSELANENSLDDGDTASVEYDLDDDLTQPDTQKVIRLWQQHGKNFIVGKRYFLGRPIDQTVLNRSLIYGLQRQREFAAMELAMIESGQPLVNTSARQH
ncbi:MAG: TIGR02270 family protein [Gammaproteobacteria bacterium]|nr:TIGR02270 family protein [Gammaproteobacteria bacterium]